MADRIKVLPDPVANQIAAGEVVNRPSSAVKEMMENAIDAGASNVTVSFRDGGKTLIHIIDDGCGMSPNDARMAFDRHATSKIDQVDDIYKLTTFGFRGEALASIASVSQVELKTRLRGEQMGTSVEINGGSFACQNPVICPEGSQFMVKNLFYNVPARRRFLEKSSTEARHIVKEYQRVVLCNPQIGFKLYDNDVQVSSLEPATLRQRVIGVAGKNLSRNLLELSADTSIVKLEGFVTNPAAARQSGRDQYLFINGRFFKSPYFHKAVLTAYEKLIPTGAQPPYFLYMTIDPKRIDVNVHPQKTEVKFEDGPEIWSIINAAVRETLARSGAVPAMDFDIDSSVQIPVFRNEGTYKVPKIEANPDFNPFERYSDTGQEESLARGGSSFRAHDTEASYDYPSQAHLPDEEEYEKSVLEFISGQDTRQGELQLEAGGVFSGILPINDRYAATVIEGALAVVDLRRAYQAVLFDRYMTMLTNESSVSQQLLFPEKIAMSLDDYNTVRAHQQDMAAIGFDLVYEGDLEVTVNGVPADLAGTDAVTVVYDMIDMLRETAGKPAEKKKLMIAGALASVAGTYGSKSGSPEQQRELVQQLLGCANPNFTPSGQPVYIIVSAEDIKQQFNRQ